MIKAAQTIGLEINPNLIGVLFTDRIGETLRLFCYYTNAEISQFDMPVGENNQNLRELFTALKLEPTCTSLVMEEAVQGRVYLKYNEEYWLYTILKTPGQTMPPLNADIAQLEWQTVWKTSEVEILHYVQVNGSERCYAIRTQISAGDATRLMENSHAFIRPVSIPRKKPQRWLYLNLALVLLALAFFIGGSIYYTFEHRKVVKVPAVAEIQSVTANYYLLFNRKISGPFPVKSIADMNTAGLLNPETLVRPEGATDWIKLSDLPLNPPSK